MKKMTIASILAGGVVSAAVFSGCIKTSGWSVNGKIDGASNGEKMAFMKLLYLQTGSIKNQKQLQKVLIKETGQVFIWNI